MGKRRGIKAVDLFCPRGKAEASRRITNRKEIERAKYKDRDYNPKVEDKLPRKAQLIMDFQQGMNHGKSVSQIEKERKQKIQKKWEKSKVVDEKKIKRLRERVVAEEAERAAKRAAKKARKDEDAKKKKRMRDEEDEEEEDEYDDDEYDDGGDEGEFEGEDLDEDEVERTGMKRGRKMKDEEKEKQKKQLSSSESSAPEGEKKLSRAERNKLYNKKKKKAAKNRKRGQKQAMLRMTQNDGQPKMDKKALKKLRREGIDMTDAGTEASMNQPGMHGFALQPPSFVGIEKLDRKLDQKRRKEELRAKLQAELDRKS